MTPTAIAPTAQRIEEAALEAFFERGFRATTTREIALAVGLTAGSLYNHFPSKEQILASIVHRVHADLEALLDGARAAAGPDPRARLSTLARAHALFHTRFRKEARVANGEIHSLPVPDRAAVIAARSRMWRWFAEELESGARAGVFDVTDPAVTTMAILNMGIRIADWFRPDGRLRAEEVAELHATLALRMAGAR